MVELDDQRVWAEVRRERGREAQKELNRVSREVKWSGEVKRVCCVVAENKKLNKIGIFVFFWKTKQKFYKHEPEHDKSTRNKRREKKEKKEKRKEKKKDWEQTRERGVAGEGLEKGL